MRRVAQFAGLLLFAMLVGSLAARPETPRVHVSDVRWVHVKDAYEVHERYVVKQPDGTLVMVGEIYTVQPGDVVGVCSGGNPKSFDNVQAATEYVRHCEVTK